MTYTEHDKHLIDSLFANAKFQKRITALVGTVKRVEVDWNVCEIRVFGKKKNRVLDIANTLAEIKKGFA